MHPYSVASFTCFFVFHDPIEISHACIGTAGSMPGCCGKLSGRARPCNADGARNETRLRIRRPSFFKVQLLPKRMASGASSQTEGFEGLLTFVVSRVGLPLIVGP